MREKYILLKKYNFGGFFHVNSYFGVLYVNEKTEFKKFTFSMYNGS